MAATAGRRPRPDRDEQDRVRLTDLAVIERFSLAVRSATAPRAEVVAALEADLAALRAEAAPAPRPVRRPRPAGSA